MHTDTDTDTDADTDTDTGTGTDRDTDTYTYKRTSVYERFTHSGGAAPWNTPATLLHNLKTH